MHQFRSKEPVTVALTWVTVTGTSRLRQRLCGDLERNLLTWDPPRCNVGHAHTDGKGREDDMEDSNQLDQKIAEWWTVYGAIFAPWLTGAPYVPGA